jgi:hypothetical protein
MLPPSRKHKFCSAHPVTVIWDSVFLNLWERESLKNGYSCFSKESSTLMMAPFYRSVCSKIMRGNKKQMSKDEYYLYTPYTAVLPK